MPKPLAFRDWPSRLPVTFGPYRAVADRVIDGDTAVFQVDAGLDQYPVVAIRLLGASAPELREAGGLEAKAFLEGLLPPGEPVLLRTEKDDAWRRTFERFLASVRLADGRDVASEMVAAGHAKWT